MDTIFTPRTKAEKAATGAAGIVIAICLLITQTAILAKDLGIGVYTGISPSLNYIKIAQEKEELEFKKSIERKYQGNKIVEVEKGVHHVKILRYYQNKPVRINVVELSRNINNDLDIQPTIATDFLAGKRKISTIAEREEALVAINGGYFKPQTGVPLGTLMIDKQLYTGPIYDRVAMGISEDG